MNVTTARLLTRKKYETQIDRLDEDTTKKVREAAEKGEFSVELQFKLPSNGDYSGSELFIWDKFVQKSVEASGFAVARYVQSSFVSIFVHWD